MYKKIVFAFCGYLISFGLFAQNSEIEKVLQEVEKIVIKEETNEKVIDSEAIVLVPAREPGFNIEKLEEVWAQFEAART